jgi:hypothetical protein
VRTPEEEKLFSNIYNKVLMQSGQQLSNQRQDLTSKDRGMPSFEKMAQEWMDSGAIDGKTILAKDALQLKKYYKKTYRKKREAAQLRKLMQDRGYNPAQYRSFRAVTDSSDDSCDGTREESAEEVLLEDDQAGIMTAGHDIGDAELAEQLNARATLTASGPRPITPLPALGDMASTYEPPTASEVWNSAR